MANEKIQDLVKDLLDTINDALEEVEKGFKINHIKTVKYNDLVSYVNNLEELEIDILGRDDLKKFIHNSNEDDIFIKITSDFLGYECYAMAYINCRTKEICYCYDDQF